MISDHQDSHDGVLETRIPQAQVRPSRRRHQNPHQGSSAQANKDDEEEDKYNEAKLRKSKERILRYKERREESPFDKFLGVIAIVLCGFLVLL
jgi:hypothetical protein